MSEPKTIEAWHEAPCGLLTLTPDGSVIEANRTFLGWVGRNAEEVVGRRRLSDLLSVGGRIYWETHLAPLLHVEGRVQEVALELKTPAGRLPVLLTAELAKSHAADADVVRVAISRASERARFERELVAARTSAERSAARVRVLQDTTAALSQAVGVAAVAEALVAAALGPLGAVAAVVWIGDHERGFVVRASGGDHPDVAVVPPSPAQLRRAAAVDEDGRLFVPLHGHIELQGVLSVIGSHDAGADELDVEVLTAIGLQAGLALDRAQLYEQSADVARTLQQSLLAVEPPADARFAVATSYRPGVELLEVGGDWYDVFVVGDELLAVVIGDVVGRGIGAASAMGQLRSAVRAVADPAVGPGQVLSRLDRFVEQVEAASMATMVYAELDLGSGSVRYSSAGHPPPLLLPAVGQPRLLWHGRSTPLGAFVEPQQRAEALVQLEPGDRLLLYTDGLVERRERDIDAGLDVLARIASRVAEQTLPDIVRSVTELMLQDEVTRDDVCVLLLSWAGSLR